MQDLKKYLLFIFIAVCCFGISQAQPNESSEQLITPVLEPALPTDAAQAETQATDAGPRTEQSNRSFLPQGLQSIFQQKPKQPAQATPVSTASVAATTTANQQQAQVTQNNLANLKEGFQPGNIAYDFRLLNMEGQTVQLSSLRGRPVVLNFWGLNCPPCIEELPILQKADREINGQYRGLNGANNAHFILVALKSNTEETKPFLEELGINMNTLIEATLDQHSNLPYNIDDTESVFRDYRAFGLPTTFLIDPTGIIQSKRIGAFVNEAELSHYLKSLNVSWQPMQQ